MGAVTGSSGLQLGGGLMNSLGKNDVSNPNSVFGTGIGGTPLSIQALNGIKGLNIGGGGGGLSGLTGTAGGVAGTNLPAPQMANIQQGTDVGNVQQAQQGTANSLQSQQALLAALQSQNGLGQQNAIGAQQQGLYNQLQAANGIGTQNAAIQGLQGVAGQQANTAGMYQNIANGVGPNPAQAMLNQQTGANVANQAALMAGQRGAGSNVGLLARQAGQQGAATQQQAVGQGATMQAQQQLGALSGLTAQQQAQAATQQAIGGLGSQQLGAQQAQQAAQAAQANQVAGQQIGQTTTTAQANLANQQQMQNALQGINTSNVASQGNVNAANASLANTQMQGQQALLGGVGNAAGQAAGMIFGAEGGVVKKMAAGGSTVGVPVLASNPINGPQSSFGQFLSNWSANPENYGSGAVGMLPETKNDTSKLQSGVGSGLTGLLTSLIPAGAAGAGFGAGGTEALGGGAGVYSAGNAAGGIDAAAGDLGSGAGTAELEQGASQGVEAGAESMAARGGLASKGGHVKAKKESQKPEKKGNSYDNDKIPAMLSAGEIVIPRSVTMSADPVKNSAAFVNQVLAKRRSK